MTNQPTLEEILTAIKSIKSGKLDGIPAEIFKYKCTDLPAQLLKFYRICWTAKELPQLFKDALKIALKCFQHYCTQRRHTPSIPTPL